MKTSWPYFDVGAIATFAEEEFARFVEAVGVSLALRSVDGAIVDAHDDDVDRLVFALLLHTLVVAVDLDQRPVLRQGWKTCAGNIKYEVKS